MPEPGAPGSPSPAPPGRLLIVDDEAAQMKALCDTLRDEGYATQGFVSPRAALAALEAGAFDLLLADLAMPGMDGIALLRAARERDPDLVGVIMTGEGTIATAVEAMKVGALDYVLKPFRLSVVLPVLARALAMRRLRMENAALERSLRERAAELEAANKELDAFAFSISHDLRTPLRALTGFSRLLAERHGAQLSSAARELLGDVRRAAQRMDELIEDLLRFSRLGRQLLAKRGVDLGGLVREVLRELPAPPGAAQADVRLGELPEVVADPSLLRQVFSNLLSNALKFSSRRERPVVEVGCERRGSEHVFFVRDNGAGFDPQYATRLFGVFQRLHSQEQFPGTGVGLSLVQRIVHRHGGRVWAEGAPDQGATFRFTLPG